MIRVLSKTLSRHLEKCSERGYSSTDNFKDVPQKLKDIEPILEKDKSKMQNRPHFVKIAGRKEVMTHSVLTTDAKCPVQVERIKQSLLRRSDIKMRSDKVLKNVAPKIMPNPKIMQNPKIMHNGAPKIIQNVPKILPNAPKIDNVNLRRPKTETNETSKSDFKAQMDLKQNENHLLENEKYEELIRKPVEKGSTSVHQLEKMVKIQTNKLADKLQILGSKLERDIKEMLISWEAATKRAQNAHKSILNKNCFICAKSVGEKCRKITEKHPKVQTEDEYRKMYNEAIQEVKNDMKCKESAASFEEFVKKQAKYHKPRKDLSGKTKTVDEIPQDQKLDLPLPVISMNKEIQTSKDLIIHPKESEKPIEKTIHENENQLPRGQKSDKNHSISKLSESKRSGKHNPAQKDSEPRKKTRKDEKEKKLNGPTYPNKTVKGKTIPAQSAQNKVEKHNVKDENQIKLEEMEDETVQNSEGKKPDDISQDPKEKFQLSTIIEEMSVPNPQIAEETAEKVTEKPVEVNVQPQVKTKNIGVSKSSEEQKKVATQTDDTSLKFQEAETEARLLALLERVKAVTHGPRARPNSVYQPKILPRGPKRPLSALPGKSDNVEIQQMYNLLSEKGATLARDLQGKIKKALKDINSD